jgi:hypothetical protein
MLENLRNCKSTEEAHELLKGLKKADLFAIVAELGFTMPKNSTKSNLAHEIIDITCGVRLRQEMYHAIRQETNGYLSKIK